MAFVTKEEIATKHSLLPKSYNTCREMKIQRAAS